MSRYYDDYYNDEFGGARVVQVQSSNATLERHASDANLRVSSRSIYTGGEAMLSVPTNTGCRVRSVSTGAVYSPPQTTTVIRKTTIRRSASSSRDRCRSRTRSRGGTTAVIVRQGGSRYRSRSARSNSRGRSRDGTTTVRRVVVRRSVSRSRSRGRTPWISTNDMHHHHHHHHHHERSRSRGSNREVTVVRADMRRPSSRTSYIRVRVTLISIDTCEAYNLRWEWDTDRNFIIIRARISPEFQEELIAHTRRTRVTSTSRNLVISRPTTKHTVTTRDTTLKANVPDRNNLYVVRRDRSRSVGRTVVIN